MDESASLTAVFVGQGTLLVRCAEVFLQAGHRVATVVSTESRVQQWAAERGISYVSSCTDLPAAMPAAGFDYLFSVANMRVLDREVLTWPRRGAINFHDSLLPRFAGAHATSWAIMHGETEHGITWHEMLERVDAGRILKQRAFALAADETAVSLNARCYEAGIEAFAELVAELASGTVTGADPRLSERTYFPFYRRPNACAVIDWDAPAAQIGALCRALDFGPQSNPLGVPKVDLGDTVLLAPRVEVLADVSTAAPGTVVRLDDHGMVVATATADVRLPELLSVDGRRLRRADLGLLGVTPGTELAPVAVESLTAEYAA